MKPNRIVIAGGTGFLGQVLARHVADKNHEVVILTRRITEPSMVGRQIIWDGKTIGDWARELDGASAVINLSGKSVNCRYHAKNRKEILDSRVYSTRVIGEAINCCKNPPSVWLNSSTATLYRHTFGKPWDETGETEASAEAKDKFSVEVGWAWEKALNKAPTQRTRKVALRTAMVLGLGKNSVFPVLHRMARLGLGGRMGSGRQYVSWIHETDFCRAIDWLIAHPEFTGPVNLVSPNPIPNAKMMRILRKICHAPFGLPATNWMLEIGAFFLRTETELLIKSRRVVPGWLLRSGFEFRHPQIEDAFTDLAARQLALKRRGGVST